MSIRDRYAVWFTTGGAQWVRTSDSGCALVAHCHLGLGKLYRQTGDRMKGSVHLTTATTMYREMDMGFWLAQAEGALKQPAPRAGR